MGSNHGGHLFVSLFRCPIDGDANLLSAGFPEKRYKDRSHSSGVDQHPNQ